MMLELSVHRFDAKSEEKALGVIKHWYESKVLPGLLNSLMKSPDMTEIRRRWVPEASGDVIEIGVGSGLNLPFYQSGARVFAVDPSEELQVFAREVAEQSGTIVDFCAQSGESIPADDNQFDSAVITWTMCTIPNPLNALMEIKRVLKPGGHVYFAEHGLSPDVEVAKWQHRINGIWKPLAGGCNLNRRPDQMLAEAGFTIDPMETGHIQGPKFATYTYQGFASA